MDSVDDVDTASGKWRAGGGLGDWDSYLTVAGRVAASFSIVVAIFGSHEVLQKCFMQKSLSCLLATI